MRGVCLSRLRQRNVCSIAPCLPVLTRFSDVILTGFLLPCTEERNVSTSYAKNASRIRFFSPSDYSEMMNESNRIARIVREYDVQRDMPIIFGESRDADVYIQGTVLRSLHMTMQHMPERSLDMYANSIFARTIVGYDVVFVNGEVQNRSPHPCRLNGNNLGKNEKRRVSTLR